jgi:hypothetical protein
MGNRRRNKKKRDINDFIISRFNGVFFEGEGQKGKKLSSSTNVECTEMQNGTEIEGNCYGRRTEKKNKRKIQMKITFSMSVEFEHGVLKGGGGEEINNHD